VLSASAIKNFSIDWSVKIDLSGNAALHYPSHYTWKIPRPIPSARCC